MNRYNFVLPQELYDEVATISRQKGVLFGDVLRRFIQLGIHATNIEDDPDMDVIVRVNGQERTITLFK